MFHVEDRFWFKMTRFLPQQHINDTKKAVSGMCNATTHGVRGLRAAQLHDMHGQARHG